MLCIFFGKPVCEAVLRVWNWRLSPSQRQWLHIEPKISWPAAAIEPLNLEAVYENALAEALKGMAVAGYGLSWLPQSLISRALATGELVPAGGSFWHVPLTIRLYRCDSEMTPQVKRVWTAASDVARNGRVKDGATQDGASDLSRAP